MSGGRQADRQTGRETETVGHVGRQSGMWADRDSQAGRQAKQTETVRQAGRQRKSANKQVNGWAVRHRHVDEKINSGWKTDRNRNIQKYTGMVRR